MPSAPNLDKIKDSISNSLDIISNKSEYFIEISKLKYKIHSEENSMEDLYKDIGKELYAIFKTNNHIDDSLLDYCKTLKKIEARIKNLEKKLNKIDNKK
ncbi:zinc ribbon domain-containing protein [Clostridium sp. CM028]|uniref:zinc ribbon domain-containing protein n=1 Tax=Clostridium TaxID=1485 RepID=UPI0013EEC9C0|nr:MULTISPECIES: zinc ribbon domain-containing protein [Clostridium]MBU3093029.1 zinc ribbon domain-containing protein [Clostridium sp. CF011]MBW9145009.1 zinc ribbon domain-containing protein [Clostridium sp. CM027]MBW9148581.1 zinc ribbon domain-containing protein [Clostridium sp. CM028]MBZ9609623.1 zinc ribbon domain-containing protein [Clostridium estertheticum]UVE40141.1 zinc ribbon domain-containing protein [Clostridium sp. CM027]